MRSTRPAALRWFLTILPCAMLAACTAITLHEPTRDFSSPARIEHASGGMTISGEMTIAQSEFGTPSFAVLGDALQVQDRLALRYRIVAANPWILFPRRTILIRVKEIKRRWRHLISSRR